MPNYANLAATASRLIQSAGISRTVIVAGSNSPDGSKPWLAPGAPRGADAELSITISGVQVPLTDGAALGLRKLDDDLKKRTQAVFLFEPPAFGDLGRASIVRDPDGDWRVTFIDRLRPADVTLLYFVGARR